MTVRNLHLVALALVAGASQATVQLSTLLDGSLGESEARDVALLIVGEDRGFNDFSIWKTQVEHVVTPIVGDGVTTLSTFFCGPRPVTDEAQKALHYKAADSRNYPTQRDRIAGCFNIVRAFEEASNVTFSHYVRIRPDSVWYAPLPALPHAAVGVRARVLFSGTPLNLTDDSLSWLDSCGPTPFHQESARDRLQPLSIPKCVMVDDQFAAVPRRFSAYFSVSGDGAEYNSTGLAESAQEMVGSYGPSVSSYLEACNAVGGFDFGSMWAEGTLSMALARAHVPVAVQPAPFRLHDSCFVDGKSEYKPGCTSHGSREYLITKPSRTVPC
jgi:hypothetical protein